jgi:hypothetical protein
VYLECNLGLVQIVNKPTRGNSIFDKFFTNHPDVSQFDVVTYLIKTKHKAVGYTLNDTLEMAAVTLKLFARKYF